MTFQPLHEFVVKRSAAAGGAESTVAGCPAGTPGDLRKFGRREIAELIAVELPIGGERDVIHVKIEAHADRVGGDEIVDVTRLIQRDLGIAGPRRQCAENHRCSAALAANQFGDRIDFVGRERDDGRAARQPRHLAVAGKGQLRQARARDDVCAWQQPLDHRPNRGGPENQRFLAAAPVQDSIGEDVSALEIRRDLDFVDRHESRIEIARHRLDGRDPEARIGGLDLLFAGNQRDRVRADPVGNLVVDLAREQAQWQPDQAGGMREHPFDGQVGLAGIGGAEHGGNASAAFASVASNARRK